MILSLLGTWREEEIIGELSQDVYAGARAQGANDREARDQAVAELGADGALLAVLKRIEERAARPAVHVGAAGQNGRVAVLHDLRHAARVRAANVVGLVLLRGMLLAAAGGAIGLLGASGVARLVRTQLFQVSPFDLSTFAAAAIILAAAAALACLLPALQASRANPTEALRAE